MKHATLPLAVVIAASCTQRSPEAQRLATQDEEGEPRSGLVVPTMKSDLGEAPHGREPDCVHSCTPRVLARARYPGGLQVDARDVYYQSADRLFRVAREGGEPRAVVQDVDEILGSSSDVIVFCRRGEGFGVDVLAYPKSGGPVRALARAGACEGDTLHGYVYFAGTDDEFHHWLARAALAGGGMQEVVPVERAIEAVVTDSHRVFYLARNEVRRYDPASGQVVTLANAPSSTRLGELGPDVYWDGHGEIMKVAKSGGEEPAQVANFQSSHDFANDGERLYWATNDTDGWFRWSPGEGSLVHHRALLGPTSIAVDGTTVFWTGFDEKGEVKALQTCGCDDAVLQPVPALRKPTGPSTEEIDVFRWGYQDDGLLMVQIRDLSADEETLVGSLDSADDVVAGTRGLPTRFSIGDEYRLATPHGVRSGVVSGFSVWAGGEGNHLYVKLKSPEAPKSAALVVSAAQGPVLTKLRRTTSDPALVRRYLPALQTALEAAAVGGATRHRLKPRHVRAVEGAFGGPHVALIAVDMAARGLEHGERISAFVLGDASGALSGEIYGFDARLSAFSFEYLVDVAADGIDEVVWGSEYYEGSYTHLLRWDGDQPVVTVLSGDGA